MHSFCLQTSGVPGAISSSISRCGGGDVRTTPSQVKAPPSLPSRFSFRYSLKYFWPGNANNGKRCNGIAIDDVVVEEKVKEQEERVEGGEKGKSGENEGQSGNWVVKIMQVNFIRKNAERRYHENGDNFQELVREGEGEESGDCKGECEGCGIKEGEEREIGFDRDSFSRLLKKVPLKEAKMYAQLSYLGNLAYCIPKLKPGNFKRYKGLRFVTSSVEKKNLALKTDEVQTLSEFLEEGKPTGDVKQQKKSVYNIRVSAAYQIAASAAAYLQSHAKGVLPFKSSEENVNGGSSEGCGGNDNNAEILNSVTGVVAAKEEVKKAVADDLNSLHSSPCEWFICDDDQRATRYFVIQGSESLASWQANLLFEPVQFEEMDVLVHRGIYEAAKGMYEQMLPDIWTHLRYFGSRSAFRFTGHSLGGSLAMLMNLMLLIRGDAPRSSLLPVVTFGAPFIMCGGDHLLQKLALPRNHVQAVTLHRDIVPRAFSSRCPNHMVELLKAINGKFRGHPCLSKQKLLYAPMGELLILQPDDKFSPNHHLLPSGSGFYILDSGEGEMLLRAAQTVFLNSPHPLEILSDRSAYGFGGTIQRDHDMNSYLKSLRDVIRIELNCIRKAKRERRGRLWWPKLAFYGIRFSRFMMSLLVIVSKLLLLGTYGIISALDEAMYC